MRLLHIVTPHSGPFRTLIEALKEILTDVNIEFRSGDIDDDDADSGAQEIDLKETEVKSSKDKGKDKGKDKDKKKTESIKKKKKSKEESEEDSETPKTLKKKKKDKDSDKKKVKGGMRIMAVNSSKTALIHLKLDAENFDVFKCKKKKLIIGLNMANFFKFIKSIDKDDTLSLFIDSDDVNHLGIQLDNKGQKSVQRLRLMDLDNDPIMVPPTEFDSVITMPSIKFHNICRNMHNIAEFIEVKSVGKQLIFSCKGDIGTQEITLGEAQHGLKVKRDKDNLKIVQGIYELKHLVLFTKCTSLCNNIDIYMKNDYPLVIKYNVATLGNIHFCLSPVTGKPEDEDVDLSDSDDDGDNEEEEKLPKKKDKTAKTESE